MKPEDYYDISRKIVGYGTAANLIVTLFQEWGNPLTNVVAHLVVNEVLIFGLAFAVFHIGEQKKEEQKQTAEKNRLDKIEERLDQLEKQEELK